MAISCTQVERGVERGYPFKRSGLEGSVVEGLSRTVTNSKRGATVTRRLALAFALLWRMIVGGGRSALSPPCFGNGSARLGVMDYPGRHHSTAVFPSAIYLGDP